MLIILGGLPGSGKTTIAARLAYNLGALHLRIDTIEQAMISAGQKVSGPEGYLVAYGIAADNLKQGITVIADSVNPIEYTRSRWRDTAQNCGVDLVEIEIACSAPHEHRRRVETRQADIKGHILPTWQQVTQRHYEPWEDAAYVDTAGRDLEAVVDEIEALVHKKQAKDNPIKEKRP
jgi:predicted kinase